ncbi:7483_t:CDS:2 [Funneliformis caledonium]|uniref:7483_t:CDS:1 n=1 Tax=Funneliformis caledonium TaxID=1117310 RepID=A0A9N8V5R3_9GLOM|nr:7483_t:CDS:2 [Funneliformis caledonium]
MSGKVKFVFGLVYFSGNSDMLHRNKFVMKTLSNVHNPIINNGRVLGTRFSRNNQRRTQVQRREQQIRNVPFNNQDTLNRIANLSIQSSNDLLINEFFNGTLFI